MKENRDNILSTISDLAFAFFVALFPWSPIFLAAVISGCDPGPPKPAPPPLPIFENSEPIHQGIVREGPVPISDSLGVIVVEQIKGFADQFGPERVVVALKDAPKVNDKVYFRSTKVLCNTTSRDVNGNIRHYQSYEWINTLVDAKDLIQKEERKEEKKDEASALP